jgi:hypothetical protein
VLELGLDPTGIDLCQVTGNRIVGTSGHGVALKTFVRSAMIKQNVIEGTGTGGIVMEAGSSGGAVTIENNQVLSIAPNDPGRDAIAIGLVSVESAEVASNTIKGVLLGERSASSCAGIRAMGCRSLRIIGNDVTDVGPVQEGNATTAGIDVIGSFDRLDIFDNSIRRQEQRSSEANGNWYAVRVSGLKRPGTPFPGIRLVPVVSSMMVARTAPSGSPREAARVRGTAVMDQPPTAVAGNIGWVVGDLSGVLIKLQQGREGISVRGNLMQSEGFGPVIDINVPTADACLFSDNRCFLEASAPRRTVGIGEFAIRTGIAGSAEGPARIARVIASIVKIEVRSVVVSANYIEGPKNVQALQATVVKDGDVARATILGNISTGGMMLNDVGLESLPWAAFNVITP